MSIQGSPEWFAERAGKFTGSRFADVLARSKSTGKHLKAYDDLIEQIAAERITLDYEDGVQAKALKWGHEVEPFARNAYEVETGLIVQQVGFIIHPKYDFAGASPDGLVGMDGGIEIKCPISKTVHLARFRNGMEEDHMPQVQGAMWVTGRKWWDFISYDPRPKGPYEHLRLYRQRVMRDQAFIDHLEREVIVAEARVREILKSYHLEERKAA
jgi:predicted phage-related endonuclease